MATVKHHKVVAALPAVLEPDAIYYVRTGGGFDQYVTNGAGLVVASPLNADVRSKLLDPSGLPAIRPSLRLDFLNYGDRLDPRITFTRSTGGGRFNAAGQYEWLPANQPRIDYDPVTGECRGLLIEEQRTNLLTYSEDFGNAAWQKAPACVVTPNTAMSPDGSLAADSIKSTGTSASENRSQQFVTLAVTAGTVLTFSVWLRADSPVTTTLRLANQADADGENVAVTLTSTWARFTVTRVFTASASAVRVCINSQSAAVTVYAWGAQLEAGTSPSSYIPTTDAQVTRAADVASVHDLSGWYRQDEGTLVVEAIAPNTTQSYARTAGIEAPGKSIISIQRNGNNARGFGTGYSLDLGNQSFPANTPVKLALSVGGGHASLCTQGVTVVTSSAGSLDAPTKLHIGSSNTGSNYLNGHIKSIKYLPRRVSDDELKALTV